MTPISSPQSRLSIRENASHASRLWGAIIVTVAALMHYMFSDYVSFANGSTTACPSLKAIRSKCYQEGVDKGDIKYEHQCYCSADNAYQVVQCFAEQYSQMESGPVRDNVSLGGCIMHVGPTRSGSIMHLTLPTPMIVTVA